jgi:spore coat polysaccharide biosynthesis protein SpsF
MKTAVFIPVRIGSTRLPKKSLLQIKGKKVVEHLIERVKLSKTPDLIVLCTTKNPEDKILVEIAKRNKIEYFRGSEKDVLKRYLDAAIKYNVDFIVNVDGDDILCDPEFIDKAIRHFKSTDADFIKYEGLPLGASPCGIKVDALRKVCELKAKTDTETGWGRYFTDTRLFKVECLRVKNRKLRHPEIRMTLDYPEDYEFFKLIFDRLYKKNRMFTLREVLDLLEKEPDIANINKHLQGKYWEHFEKHGVKVKLKDEKGRT